MANMSYCRFGNTSADLDDCYENMDDLELSDDEILARERLIKLCVEIACDYGDEVGPPYERA